MDIRLTMLLTWATVSTIFGTVALGLWIWARPGRAAIVGAREVERPVRRGELITLPLTLEEADAEAAERLAETLAARALAQDPTLAHAEVVDASGHRVLRLARNATPRVIALPEVLHEPHLARRHAPSPVRPGAGGGAPPRALEPAAPDTPPPPIEPLGGRPAAARYRLPPQVHALLVDPRDHVDLVRAILTAAGDTVTRRGDLIDAGDVAIVVVPVEDDAERALGYGYLRLQSTPAPTKVLLHLGYVPPEILTRHRAAAPAVHHADGRTIQQLADAVAVGLDPRALLLP
ncbi:MAG: hypothetical protein JJT89_03100 [Nitriliruptoraceae bacterium]|nr:hypothetical protein [Nitriliruptoraceae bacterium]